MLNNPSHTASAPTRRHWTYFDPETTYDEWLKKEKKRDEAFHAQISTVAGRAFMTAVMNRFRGLEKPMVSKSDITWFLREASTPGSLLWMLLDTMLHNGTHRPPLSPYQLVLLAILTSPKRRLLSNLVALEIQGLSLYWAFPGRRAELDNMVKEALASGLFICTHHNGFRPEEFGLHAGEENAFGTDRWVLGSLKDFLTPPYDPIKRLPPTEQAGAHVPAQMKHLPDELLLEVITAAAAIDGLVGWSSFARSGFSPKLKAPAKGDVFIIPDGWVREDRSNPSFPWDVQAVAKPRLDQVSMILELGCVAREWKRVVAEAFFSNSVLFEHIVSGPDSAFGHKGVTHGNWFFPHRTVHDIAKAKITLRYDVHLTWEQAPQSMIGPHEVDLHCERDVLNFGGGPAEFGLLSMRDDPRGLSENRFVRYDEKSGLQVRGYWFWACFDDLPGIPPAWQYRLQHFIWFLMRRPNDVPMEIGKYSLDLGDWRPEDIDEFADDDDQ